MGKETDSYVRYCLARIEVLVAHGVRKVIMVFDGGPLPSKEGTEIERAASRAQNNELARRLMREGNVEAARGAFAKSVDVCPRMAARVMEAMAARWGRSGEQVDWLVAPYEADAQLGYLARQGLADVIISEDSDNLPYGVDRVCFKWDGHRGEQALLAEVLAMRGDKGSLDFAGWTHAMLLYMCVLSGCDYLPSVPGVGVKAAHKLVARHREPKQLLRALRFQFDVKVPLGYERGFYRAVRTFQHQRVFDPRSGTVVPLTPEPHDFVAQLRADGDDGSDDPRAFLGEAIAPATAAGIARGLLDPVKPYAPFATDAGAIGAAAAGVPPPAPVDRRSQPGIGAFFGKAPGPALPWPKASAQASFPPAKRPATASASLSSSSSASSPSSAVATGSTPFLDQNAEGASTEDPILVHGGRAGGAESDAAGGVASSRHFGGAATEQSPVLKKRALASEKDAGASGGRARRGLEHSAWLAPRPAPRPGGFRGLKKFAPPAPVGLAGKENTSEPALGRFAFSSRAPKAMLTSAFLTRPSGEGAGQLEASPAAAVPSLESFAYRAAAPSPAPSNGYGYDSLSPPVSAEHPHLRRALTDPSPPAAVAPGRSDRSCPACRGRKRAHTCGKTATPPSAHAPAPSALFEEFAFGA
jgi:exonuclease-1